MRPISLLGVLVTLVAVTAVTGSSAASDVKPPKIVAAIMLDTDLDASADGLRLTYPERIRHAADRDGRYPFSVDGFRIASVGAANGRIVVVRLVEKAIADGTLRPVVRYRRAVPAAVLDRAGNRAVAQVFRAVRAHGHAPRETPAPAPLDRDGDGVADAQDCAPGDPNVKPGAPDSPDLKFVDSNCDGIDGNEENAIFASPDGKDTNPGTRAQPKREISAAVAAAAGKGKDVLAAAGTYQGVAAETGVGIYGGYDPKTWKRGSLTTEIRHPYTGVSAVGATKVVLQLLTVVGQATGSIDASIYGIRAVNGSDLTLQRVTVRAGAGSNGGDGTNGAAGAAGLDGGPGTPGAGDFLPRKLGGPGGKSPGGNPGARGGEGGSYHDHGNDGGTGTLGALGGKGGAKGDPGKRGRDGDSGVIGNPGARGAGGTASTAAAGTFWRGINGVTGTPGTTGGGGGGGGGGGSQQGWFAYEEPGNGGGGGGGAGAGGKPGTGGRSGGGSFGIYLYNSTVTVSDGSSVTAANGGAGGDGGRGGLPGAPGLGGKGGTRQTDEVGAGGNGGDGGTGGPGGGGGGGAGGPSIGVMKVGSSTATLGGTRIEVGAPGRAGAAGAFGTGGIPAQPGVARAVHP